MKKLQKKGFTLIELITIIIILSLVISLSTIIFLNVRKSILQKEYEKLVFYLETKAVEYANDTYITTISVEDLIIDGYVKSDDGTNVYDPRNNKSMNCNIIESEFVDGYFEAKLSYDSGRNSNGTCKKYTKTSYMSICKLDGDTCTEIDKNSWFNTDINLAIKYKNEILKADDDTSFSWSTNTGFTSAEASVKTNINIGEVTYTCKVVYGELIGTAMQLINIDKEKPKITNVSVDSAWSQSKVITVSANDGSGSGISGYSVVTNEGTCSNYQTSNKLTVNANGTYKVCVKDKAGNVAEQTNINVINIDNTPPTITAKKSTNTIYVGNNYNVLNTYFTVTYSSSGGTATCNYEQTGNLSVGTYTLKCTATGKTGLTASASTNLTVQPLTPSTPSVTTRYSSLNGSTYSGSWTNKNIYFDISPGKSSDVITNYQYKVGSGSWQTTYGNFAYSSEINGTIEVRACNGSNCSSSVSKTVKIDKTAPTCSLSVSSSRVSMNYMSSDVEDYGVNKSSSASYSSGSQSISTGTFYGHVYDKAGNTGKCSVDVINATPSYRKTTTTCNRKVSSYDCRASASSKKTCPSGYTAGSSNCYKKTSATLKTSYTKTTKVCKKSASGYKYTCYKIYCPYYTKQKTCGNAGCIWRQGACYGGFNTKTTHSCTGTVTRSRCYQTSTSSCSGGWTQSSKTTNYTYSWGTSSTSTVSSCTNNKITCNSNNVGKTYASCQKGSSYSCSTGTLSGSYCYSYSSFTYKNVCSTGSLSGSYCYLYDKSYCPSGFSTYNTNYSYYTSDSTTTVSSCSTTYAKSCNSSNVGSSYVSKCTINSYTCSYGYSMAGTYCYR